MTSYKTIDCEKEKKVYEILNRIKYEIPYVDVKPYSHNIIGINLDILEGLIGRDKTLMYMKLLRLNKLGWCCE